MDWWQALLLGIVQGLTEFLPVSSSGHLMIFRELLGIDTEGFLDFTVTVHFATVLSTIIVFWHVIWNLLKGLFKFKFNDETDYILKLIVSMIPIGIVGLCFKDQVEGLFADNLFTVGVCLIITAILLFASDQSAKWLPQGNAENRNTGTDCHIFRHSSSDSVRHVPWPPAFPDPEPPSLRDFSAE